MKTREDKRMVKLDFLFLFFKTAILGLIFKIIMNCILNHKTQSFFSVKSFLLVQI
jgi:hypothetical protein